MRWAYAYSGFMAVTWGVALGYHNSFLIMAAMSFWVLGYAVTSKLDKERDGDQENNVGGSKAEGGEIEKGH